MMVLQTNRLTLCHLSPGDAPFILELLNTPAWLRYIGDRHVHSLDDARKYITQGPMRSYVQHGFGLWLIVSRQDNVPMGICGLLKRAHLSDPDIGFALHPSFEGQGYAQEAAAATLDYAKNSLGLSSILAITTPDNEPSKKLLGKLGFQYQSIITQDNENLMLFALS